MVDDATVNLVAGTNITIFRNDSGINISAASGGGGSPGYYGTFHDTTNQSLAAANTAYPITLNTTDSSNGVTVSSGSRVNFQYGGTYNVQFSVQLSNADTQIHDATLWLRKNGTDVVASSGIISVPNSHGGVHGQIVSSWNYVMDFVAGDYIQFYWSATNTNVALEYVAAGSSPTRPASPSIIVTVSQVVNIAAPGSISAGQISSVNASSIIGSISATQIGSVNASSITGTITASQIGAVNASSITGTITSSQIGSVTASSITGTISASQIGSVNASAITGSINSSQISSVTASSITGSITSGQIGSVSAGTITGVIVTSQLTDQILNTQRLIANDISVIRRVTSNPTLPNTNYPSGCIILNTTNKTLYQNSSGTWTAVTSSSNITGTLTSNDIASVNANSITGLIIASQIGSVNATSITGTISSSQIGSVSASTITGTITSSQIASVSAASITGSITASQILSVNSSAITGSITASQISSVNATAITGTITSTQIGSINASTITVGLIGDSQINTISAGKLTAGTIVATVALESPKIAVAGSCYNSSSYTSNTFASTTLRWDDDGTTKPSGFGGGSYSYLNMPGVTLYGWGNGSGAFGTRYGRTDPKISVFSSAEFSNISSGNYVSYVVQYTTDGVNWYQVTPIDSSVYNPNTFVSSSGAVELSGLSATGSIQFRFRFNGTSGGNPTCEYCQIQVVCYNF